MFSTKLLNVAFSLVIIKVLTLLSIVVVGLAFAKSAANRQNNKNVNWWHYSPAGPDFYKNVTPIEWIARYITSMLTILFAYAGWNNLNCKCDKKGVLLMYIIY